MKTYYGVRRPDVDNQIGVSLTGPGATSSFLNIGESQKVYNHSVGFDWGYGGSGPAQTALAILLDHTGNPEEAQRWYQDFKWEFVSGWDNAWRITGKEIDAWLVQKRQGAAQKPITASKLIKTGICGCPTGYPGPAGPSGPGSIQG